MLGTRRTGGEPPSPRAHSDGSGREAPTRRRAEGSKADGAARGVERLPRPPTPRLDRGRAVTKCSTRIPLAAPDAFWAWLPTFTLSDLLPEEARGRCLRPRCHRAGRSCCAGAPTCPPGCQRAAHAHPPVAVGPRIHGEPARRVSLHVSLRYHAARRHRKRRMHPRCRFAPPGSPASRRPAAPSATTPRRLRDVVPSPRAAVLLVGRRLPV